MSCNYHTNSACLLVKVTSVALYLLVNILMAFPYLTLLLKLRALSPT
jgi:hypothetical protein